MSRRHYTLYIIVSSPSMKKYFLLLLAAVSFLGTFAQETGVSTPYSRYGVGVLNDPSLGFNKGMAGTGIALSDSRRLNFANPASYARFDSLSFLFDVGVTLQADHRSVGNASYNDHRAQFDYLAAGFRVAPRLGFSLGLRPFSSVGYELSTENTSLSGSGGSGALTSATRYTGDGGLHQVYAGLGYMPLRGLSLGVNAAYLWGTTTHTAYTQFSSASTDALRRSYAYEVRSYTVDLGAQWSQRIGRRNEFTLGLVYGLGHDLHSSADFYNQRISSGAIQSGDTVTLRNVFSLPRTIGVGLGWNYANRLRLGLDYTLQQWSRASAPSLETLADGSQVFRKADHLFTDRHRVSFGAEYTPDPEALSWAPRVRYRLGLSYAGPYAKVDGHDGPKSYVATLGVGLPIINSRNNRSVLNVSARYELLQPAVTGALKEQFFGLSIGLSFGEKWFDKWKVE